uniref:Uncharacterized protein n=1 Tax=Eutreptiella gymnastica TaxID=73025 RepID=A0A7S4G9S8_9EUGL
MYWGGQYCGQRCCLQHPLWDVVASDVRERPQYRGRRTMKATLVPPRDKQRRTLRGSASKVQVTKSVCVCRGCLCVMPWQVRATGAQQQHAENCRYGRGLQMPERLRGLALPAAAGRRRRGVQ